MKPKLRVYFDAGCPICSREIAHYQKQTGAQLIDFINILNPRFNARAEGVDPVAVHRRFHVKTSEGEIKTGVDGFTEIWRRLPKYYWLTYFARFLPTRLLMCLGYEIFALVRPYLPRRDGDCSNSPYCQLK